MIRDDEPPYLPGKPAPGPWHASDVQGEWSVYDHYGNCTLTSADEDEAEANAKLAADAGSTYHETGLMPSELAEVLAAAKSLLANMETPRSRRSTEAWSKLHALVRGAANAKA